MMPALSLERLRLGIERRTGVGVRIESTSGSGEMIVSLRGVDARESFRVHLRLGYQRVEAEFLLGAYASGLLQEMSRASTEERMAFKGLAEAVRRGGGSVSLAISGQEYSPEEPTAWPTDWSGFRFKVVRTALDIPGMEPDALNGQLEEWAVMTLLMGMALAAQAENEEPPAPEAGLPEGAKTTITANRFERSRQNRRRCLAIHGSHCTVCGMDFGDAYGELGEGFIHVHHVTPVSQIGPDYLVDPLRDLIPVCPNCHAMLHRQEPPLSPDDLRSMMRTLRTTDGRRLSELPHRD